MDLSVSNYVLGNGFQETENKFDQYDLPNIDQVIGFSLNSRLFFF